MVGRPQKNYDGTNSPIKKMGELVPRMLEGIARKSQGDTQAIFRFWEELLGEKIALQTQCVSWVDGVLTVKVKNATLYSLLCRHEKAQLLKRLQEQFSIRDLVFRIG